VIRDRLVAFGLALASAGLPGCATTPAPAVSSPGPSTAALPTATDGRPESLQTDLDHIFEASALAGALVAVRVDSLRDGRTLYARHNTSRVIPASALKILTTAVAARRLGWDYRFETRLEMSGPAEDGVLRGDLIVIGGGDPSIAAQDLREAPVFGEWAATLRLAGITRIDGRVIGDDSAFDDEPLGAGWAWDYLSAGYAAPSGALSYNENVVVVRATPGRTAGVPAQVEIGPPGHDLEPDIQVVTDPAGSAAMLTVARLPGRTSVLIRGRVPAGGAPVIRTTTIENPSQFFVEGFRLALARRGIHVRDGARDIDDLADAPQPAARRLVARHLSAPLSSLVGYAMKVSQNYYGEMLLKAAGRRPADVPGSTERGRAAVRETLAEWKIPTDTLVLHDGSGLSRYNYVSTDLMTEVLVRVWQDERLRGPFVAALPVGGHDGTLEGRMRNSRLDRRVQAKTGTISNVRSLAGYLERDSGEKLAFTMIANHFVAPNAEIDAVMEQALERLLR
jgi:D-alanyl-D-alanine carboxypeptidase/D-alanyl-D-alanine-endopeptidase (penicillin-binding protein 4)